MLFFKESGATMGFLGTVAHKLRSDGGHYPISINELEVPIGSKL